MLVVLQLLFSPSCFQILLKLQSDFVIWICIQILADQKEIYADLSPQDSTLLSDIVEVGSLPSLARESDETWHSFYILTRQGLRYECSSISEVQVIPLLFVHFIVFYFLINLSECFCKQANKGIHMNTQSPVYRCARHARKYVIVAWSTASFPRTCWLFFCTISWYGPMFFPLIDRGWLRWTWVFVCIKIFYRCKHNSVLFDVM